MKRNIYILTAVFLALLFAGSAKATAQTPFVKVIQPIGGETWGVGTTHLISWTDNLTKPVAIQISVNGSVYTTISGAGSVSGSTWSWTIPSSIVVGSVSIGTSGKNCKIKVESTIDKNIFDESTTFRIVSSSAKSIHMEQPNVAGIKWALGTKHLISWSKNFNNNVDIYLVDTHDTDSTEYLIKSAVSGSSYSWVVAQPDTMPSPLTVPGFEYRIKIYNHDDYHVNTLSDNYFAIIKSPEGSSIKVNQPDISNIKWARGSTHLISWSDNISSSVDILLSDDNFTTSTTLVSSVHGSTYSWPIPSGLATGTYKIRVISHDDSTVYSTSSNTFSIVKSASGSFIHIEQPNVAGIKWALGTKHLISWSKNFNNNVDVYLVDASGSGSSEHLIKNDVSGNSFNWTVTSTGTKAAPLSGNLKNRPANSPSAWLNNLGERSINSRQNPSRTHQNTGSQTVALKAAKHEGNTETKENYVSTIGSGNANSILWQDNFDNDNLNSFPANWIPSGNGNTSYVTKNNYYSSPHSLSVQGISGSNWEGLVHRVFDNKYKHYQFEFAYLYTGQGNVGNHPSHGDFLIKSVPTWRYGYGRAFISFDTKMHIICYPSRTIIGNYSVNKWVKIKVDYQKLSDTVRLRYYINGKFVHEEYDKAITGENNLKYFTFRSGDTRCLLDDISVRAITKQEYKIKIYKHDDHSVYGQSDNYFSIVKSPVGSSIKIIQPQASGIQWARGTSHLISWTDNISSPVDILLSDNNFITSTTMASSVHGSTWTWPVPSGLAAGTYKVRVISHDDSTVYSTSSNTFSIVKSAPGTFIQIKQPTVSGIKWARGTTHLISWTKNFAGNVDVYLTDTLGIPYSEHLISDNISGDSYSWTIPTSIGAYALQIPGTKYRIKVYKHNDHSIYGQSNHNFSIIKLPENSFITVVQPNGGEQWGDRTKHLISWNSNIKGRFNIGIEAFHGTVSLTRELTAIDSNVVGTTYSWYIPAFKYGWGYTPNGKPATSFKVIVSSVDDSAILGESAKTFEIYHDPPGSEITIIQPNGGESWKIGSTHLISWNDNISEKVHIILLHDDMQHGTYIANHVSGTTFSWKIGKDLNGNAIKPGKKYMIMVQSVDVPNVYGVSKNYFSLIEAPKIDVYPNPSTTHVTLKFDDTDNEDYSLMLYNRYNMRVMYRQVNTTYMKKVRINIFDLPNGIYFLRLISGKQVLSRKIIVQH